MTEWLNWTELNRTILLVLDVDFFLAMNCLIRRLLINSSVLKIFYYMSLIIETNKHIYPVQFSSVQSLSHVRLFVTPWTAARQASLSITNSQSPSKPMSIESVMPSTISSSVVPFSSCPQSFPASGSFQMSQLFASGGQSIGVSTSTSVLPHPEAKNIT